MCLEAMDDHTNDEDKMNGIVNGILQKYKDAADNGEWGKLVGILNKSF
jgi:hypothetical protein